MLEAYFDESGTHEGSNRMCVAGYLIESDQAKRMNDEWNPFLQSYGLAQFHMVDCAHGTEAFKHISKTCRIKIAKHLINLTKQRVEMGVAVSVSQNDFDLEARPKWITGAYTLCAQWCILGVIGWWRKHNYGGQMAYFFESGHALYPEVDRFMNFLGTNPGPEFPEYAGHAALPKSKHAGLDAADLLAWEWTKEYVNASGCDIKHKIRNRRLSLMSLLDKTHLTNHWQKKDLSILLDDFGKHTGGLAEFPQSLRTFSIEPPQRTIQYKQRLGII